MVKKATKKKSSKTVPKVKSVKKKTVKKKTVKKAAPKKKAVRKKAAKAVNRRLKPEQYFYLKDGGVLRSLHDLARMMDDLEDEVFSHHVNEDKHDFASWIENVFEEADLARQLIESQRDKQKNHYIVLKYVVKKK